jgi:hypothetical protein
LAGAVVDGDRAGRWTLAGGCSLHRRQGRPDEWVSASGACDGVHRGIVRCLAISGPNPDWCNEGAGNRLPPTAEQKS